ncbi:uncharacterized protein TrAFT101_001500 [Trichoderma asperellum]|uniref:uncharacterized protein n=1 Tax=Trichoderma asperellum TaxID=101201 RepID=UPI00331C9783|nr:hypothetical protein TrAFT101_001500 [Trichoderma asperellum]
MSCSGARDNMETAAGSFRGRYQGLLHHAGLYVSVQQRHAMYRHNARQCDPWRRAGEQRLAKVSLW